jgi:hypothetical protein
MIGEKKEADQDQTQEEDLEVDQDHHQADQKVTTGEEEAVLRRKVNQDQKMANKFKSY